MVGVWITLACLLQQGRSEGAELTAKQAVDLLENAIQSIKSFDVKIETITRRFILVDGETRISPQGKKEFNIKSRTKIPDGEMPPATSERFGQLFQGGKGRIDDFGDKGEVLPKSSVYTPSYFKTWNPMRHEASIQNPVLAQTQDGKDYRTSFATVIGSVNLIKCLRERTNVKLAGQNGEVTIEAPPEPGRNIDFPNWGLRVTVDPSHGFMPIVIETLHFVEDRLVLMHRREVKHWKNVAGVWVPTRVLTTHFDTNPRNKDTFGHRFSDVTLIVDEDQSSWNKEILENRFLILLPAATRVVDAQRSVMYVTEKDEVGDIVPDLAHAKEVIPLNSHPLVSSSGSVLSPLARAAFVIAGGSFLIVISLLVWLRNRSKARIK